ncbi:hypothetical protein LSCM1_01842 [Leishmania martiniquensis]|uniref:Uncharacterized protein n=1 Tax=Leishmania martiniquensis TaxID=1580590 RepID=A0A836GMT0_9TRYP|nr:hypothetical protein LSCM1_01842 [Leishmania martiniquensis]
MTAVVEAIDVGNDEHYSDDSFQDDFESDSASTSHRDFPMRESTRSGAPPVGGGRAEAGESASMSVLGKVTTPNSSSGTRPSLCSSLGPSEYRRSTHSPAHVAGAANGASSTVLSASSALPSLKSSSRSASADSANGTSASEQIMRQAEQPTQEDDSSVLLADQVCDAQDRAADGCASEAHSRRSRRSADERSTRKAYTSHTGYPGDGPCGYVSNDVSLTEQYRLQRPEVPATAEELHKMQKENARMREEYFQRSREQYHTSITHASKASRTFDGNRTIGGPASLYKSAATSTVGGAFRCHREAAARLVQESLMEHRTLQVLQLEQRDLVKRRDELKKLVRNYKRASKYKDYIEIAKQDIAILTEDYHDARLEVRCNEKLLVMNEAMSEAGLSDRRLMEEVRSQNALTQRRREHALRDADSAQRVRDAALQRVEELKLELEKRRQWAVGSDNAEGYQLRVVHQAKKERIEELRGQLQQLRQGCVKLGGKADSCSKQGRVLARKYQHPHYHNQRDDAEREYLEERIAEMRREMQVMEGPFANVAASKRGSIEGEPSLAANRGFAAPSPHSETSRRGDPAPPQHAVASTVTAAYDSAYPKSTATDVAETESSDACKEIKVDAWLNAASVDESAGNEAVHSQRHSHVSDTAGSHNQEEKGGSAVYQEEGWHQAHANAPATGEDEPPAWLDAGDDGADLGAAPARADLALLSSSSSYDAAGSVEEEVLEEEALDTIEEQFAPSTAAQAYGFSKQSDGRFGAGGSATASATATIPPNDAGSNDGGPEWLNF